MNEYQELADLIFPNVKETVEDLEKKYPSRNLDESQMVTRFAPSPTGFLHTGSLFTTLVDFIAAKRSKGIFYIRLEDTDQKREIEGTGQFLIDQLKFFGLEPNEGYLADDGEKGLYGPYVQSKRKSIYDVVLKDMISKNKAYPCFCTEEELDNLRKEQEVNKVRPGYYGIYAKYHHLSPKEAISMINEGKSYVIRFKSSGNEKNKYSAYDEIKGKVDITENDQDIVICKSDGLPTYHFAHLVDDHFMRTTHIIRGEEWLASLPIHLQLFQAMNWQAPKYCHLPVIMRIDETGARKKLSKRNAEASTTYFIEKGYPVEGFLEYLMTIVNSNYEEWREENPSLSLFDFPFSFEKMSLDGALFDIAKLNFICKEVLSKMSKEEISKRIYVWASIYDQELKDLIDRDYHLFEEIMNIEREKENPRKDYEKYEDIKESIKFFYKDYFDNVLKDPLPFNPNINKEDINKVLETFLKKNDLSLDEQNWFSNLKLIADECGFASNVKDYKKNKEAYKGHIGDVAEIVRISVTTRKQTPNLYFILKILGKEEIQRRIEKVLECR